MRTKSFVFDTNSLVSALIVPSSVSRRSLEKADETGLLVFSNQTLAELNEVLIRSKFDKYVSLDDRFEYIERLEARGLLVETISTFTDCRDIKDNKFLNVAFDCKASCIVTGDRDLLVLNPFREIPIISTSHFFNEFE